MADLEEGEMEVPGCAFHDLWLPSCRPSCAHARIDMLGCSSERMASLHVLSVAGKDLPVQGNPAAERAGGGGGSVHAFLDSFVAVAKPLPLLTESPDAPSE